MKLNPNEKKFCMTLTPVKCNTIKIKLINHTEINNGNNLFLIHIENF